jgi:hypothetical protein
MADLIHGHVIIWRPVPLFIPQIHPKLRRINSVHDLIIMSFQEVFHKVTPPYYASNSLVREGSKEIEE